jgi:hypothetical protein
MVEIASDQRVWATADKLQIELPLTDSDGWRVAATFIRDADELVLAEVKVFPGAGRSAFPPVDLPEADISGNLEALRAALPPNCAPGAWSGSMTALEGLPPGGITARLLRNVRVADLHAAATRIASALSPIPGVGAVDKPTAQGRRPDVYYARYAALYDQRIQAKSRSPIKDVARLLDRPPGQVRDLMGEARRRGLLSKVVQGQAAGTLTDKARALLSEEAQS